MNVITVKWLDVNKGDEATPNYRALLVGRALKLDNRLDLLAATPPLETLCLMCSLCASNQSRRQPYKLMAVDVNRTYFYAPARRGIYIEIPMEDLQSGDETRVAKLNLSFYGTHNAAQNYTEIYEAAH